MHTGWKKAVISQGAVSMPNTYKDATYKEVLCWTADTQIKYSPNPTRGKSKIRYAKYEEAETACPGPGAWDCVVAAMRMHLLVSQQEEFPQEVIEYILDYVE